LKQSQNYAHICFIINLNMLGRRFTFVSNLMLSWW